MRAVSAQFADSGAANVQVEAIPGATDDEIIGFEISMDFDANSDLNYAIAANWSRSFESDNPDFVELQDACDTYPGNAAAGIADDMQGAVTTDVKVAFEVTAAQID